LPTLGIPSATDSPSSEIRDDSIPSPDRKKEKRLTELQQLESIPPAIRDSPHILRRTNRYVADNSTKIPRAARTKTEIRIRELPVLEAYTEVALRGEEPGEELTMEELKVASGQLRELQRQYVLRDDYQAAREACYALWRVNEQIKARSRFARTKDEVEQLICKRNELLALVKSSKEEWEELLEEQAAQTRERLAGLSDLQDEELEEFDRGVPRDLPPLWRRHSPVYYQMRSKHRHLAHNERWDEAIVLQKAADRLEGREEKQTHENLDVFWRNRRERLQERQDILFSGIVEHAVNGRNMIRNKRDREVRGQQHRIEILEREIVAKCELHGIKQGAINLELVDEDRVELVRAKERDVPINMKGCVTAQLKSRKVGGPSRTRSQVSRPASQDTGSEVQLCSEEPDETIDKMDPQPQTSNEDAGLDGDTLNPEQGKEHATGLPES
jgi:hypothetical protein